MSGLFFSVFELLHEEAEVVPLGVGGGEDALDHLGVREEDAVEGKTGSLDRVFVHLFIN